VISLADFYKLVVAAVHEDPCRVHNEAVVAVVADGEAVVAVVEVVAGIAVSSQNSKDGQASALLVRIGRRRTKKFLNHLEFHMAGA